jgi:3-dehydroquinate synthase
MRTLTLNLGERSYSIHIGSGIRHDKRLLSKLIRGPQVMVVTNEIVAPLYLDDLLAALHDFDARYCILPDGEQNKTLGAIERIATALLEARFERACTVVALGGGVTGDIAGFAAACYMRGVACVQIPTTLLAQVDSSVGGKTAVNHPLGKNMLGAFHQPRGVIADIEVLDSLDERELRAGIAEIIKYGLIGDPALFQWLETDMHRLRARDHEALTRAVERSCRSKSSIVADDEREAGARALLNLGHTFGHAIETGVGYGNWLHGEAVAAGLYMAADLSVRTGRLAAGELGRIGALLEAAGLPTCAPHSLTVERMLELMTVDKKVHGGRLRFVLLEAIGKAVLATDVDRALVRATLSACREVPAVA